MNCETSEQFTVAVAVSAALLFADSAFAQAPPVKITLDQAIQMALQHNHSLAGRPDHHPAEPGRGNHRPICGPIPRSSPIGNTCRSRRRPQRRTVPDYLHDSTEGDMGLSYLFERGKKRQHRLQAAKDATAVTRSQVADNERDARVSGWPALHQCPAGGIDARTRAAGSEELSENRGHQRTSSSKTAP